MAVFVPFVLPGERVEAEIASAKTWIRQGDGFEIGGAVGGASGSGLSIFSEVRRMPVPAHSL